jgi:hypothetical protein
MSDPADVQDPGSLETQPPPMNLASRLANVLASPGEVFDHVTAAPFRLSNWIAPALIMVVIGWSCSWMLFRQPAFDQQLREITSRAVEKQMSKQKIPEAQAEQAIAVAEKWSVVVARIGAVAAPVVVGFGFPFIWALVVWLIGTKAFGGQFDYMKAVEVCALTGMIGVLDSVLRTLLIFVTGSMFAALSPALIIKDFDPQNSAHAALALLNLMTFWSLAVRSIGLAKLSGASFARSAVWIFGLWLIYNVLTMGFGFGVQALMGR